MCGICGQYNFNAVPVNNDAIINMCRVIAHRGPDDEGVYLDKNFGMGMRRLSIIDLNTGHQPISNEDGTIWTVLNGEIYNYKELTEKLQKKGHQFKTKSDTEVIVHLYEEFGSEFVKLLRGMFGLALWDVNRKELLLARDPLGIKQLYFFRNQDMFIFGSEIKCILKILEKSITINYQALNHYFTFLYFPDDLTIFDGILKVRPGHLIKIKGREICEFKYWKLNQFGINKITFSDAKQQFLSLFEESMRLHLRSDVPLGVFLSGGIDSSIITAIGARLVDKPLNTFTVGYGGEGNFYDERVFARMVAKLFKTNHQEYLVTPDIKNAIYNLVHFFDEPFANASAIPNYYISKVMRKEVKVALSGLGGDEIAGGYERYSAIRLLRAYNKMPNFARKFIKKSIEFFPDSGNGNYFSDRCKRFVRAAGLSEKKAYFSLIAAIGEEKKQMLFSEQVRKKITEFDSFELFSKIVTGFDQNEMENTAMYFDIVSYATNDLLVLSDRTSMANSLEVRVPFFDHKLVEFMAGLPVEYKIKGLEKKYLFKESFKNILPKEILYRTKRGFSTPLSVWLRSDLKNFCLDIFSKEKIESTEVLNYGCVKNLLENHLSMKSNNQGIIFAIMTFIVWHQVYIQNKQDILECGENQCL